MKKNRFLLLMIMVIVLCFVSSTAISTVSLYQVLQKHALKNSEIIAAGIYLFIEQKTPSDESVGDECSFFLVVNIFPFWFFDSLLLNVLFQHFQICTASC